MKDTLVPRLVVTTKDWELLRVIRNTCRQGMTHNSSEINEEAQRLYRRSVEQDPRVRHYLYATPEGVTVGFSRLEERDGFIFPTYGVGSWARNLGFGRQIGQHMINVAGGPMKADIYMDNHASLRIFRSLGWVDDGPAVRGLVFLKREKT